MYPLIILLHYILLSLNLSLLFLHIHITFLIIILYITEDYGEDLWKQQQGFEQEKQARPLQMGEANWGMNIRDGLSQLTDWIMSMRS